MGADVGIGFFIAYVLIVFDVIVSYIKDSQIRKRKRND